MITFVLGNFNFVLLETRRSLWIFWLGNSIHLFLFKVKFCSRVIWGLFSVFSLLVFEDICRKNDEPLMYIFLIVLGFLYFVFESNWLKLLKTLQELYRKLLYT